MVPEGVANFLAKRAARKIETRSAPQTAKSTERAERRAMPKVLEVFAGVTIAVGPTKLDFGIRATFWVDSRRGGGRVRSASRTCKSYGQIDPPT